VVVEMSKASWLVSGAVPGVERQPLKKLEPDTTRVEKEGGQISRNEMVAMLFLLLFADHETTTHLISGSVHELLKNPGLRDWLEEDWNRANLAVEEFLRFISPVQFTKPRFVRKDIELGGVRLKKGEKIMAMLVAANLDPQANAHPEKLDLERKPSLTGREDDDSKKNHPALAGLPRRRRRAMHG
jgi:cytochrome P450